jgi:hypothetical protein
MSQQLTCAEHTCDELGVCTYYYGRPKCPGCQAQEPAPARHNTTLPRVPHPLSPYPFAPGVIQGADMPIVFLDEDDVPLFTGRDLVILVILLVCLAALGGLLAGLLA